MAKKNNYFPSRISLPICIFLCGAMFYAGILVGQRPIRDVPDIRLLEKAAQVTLNLAKDEETKFVLEDDDESQGENLEKSRRQLLDGAIPREPMGHGESGDDQFSTVPFQLLSWHPRAYYFPNFLPHDLCDEIVSTAEKHLTPSGLALREGESEDATKDVRTSQGTFLSSQGEPKSALALLENKIAKVTMIPAQHGEPFNVLRYEIGQKYDSHFDTFNPAEYGPQSSMRIASFLTYLTDVEEGGETMFPYEGYKNMDIGYDYRDCIGLKVKPKKGDGLLFWSLFPNGSIDSAALHGSCPVKKGIKFVATKWIRDKPARFWD